jgi:putative addiction module component (TIGR02574 family)
MMGDIIDRNDLGKLPAEERLKLIEELWDSLSPADGVGLADWQRAERDRRLDALEGGTSIGRPWADLRRRFSKQS